MTLEIARPPSFHTASAGSSRSIFGFVCLLTSIADIGTNAAKTNSAIDSFV